jgi:hypothetical protein
MTLLKECVLELVVNDWDVVGLNLLEFQVVEDWMAKRKL